MHSPRRHEPLRTATREGMPVAPVFIVGAGRSGTTLIRTLVSAHPSMAITPETHYWRFAERHGALEDDAVPDPEGFLAMLEDYPRFRDLGVDMRDVRALLPEEAPPTFPDIFGAMLVAYGRGQGKPRVGEKSPGHYRVIARLLESYPGTRIIYVIRDPRAVVASALVAPWVTKQLDARDSPRYSLRRRRFFHVAAQARGWSRIYGQVLDRWRHHPAVLNVHYEALVTDPEHETRRICTFLEEDWTPAMLQDRASVGGAAAGGGFDSWTAEHEAKAGAAITREGVRHWQSCLSRREIAAIEGLCECPMRTLGYALQATPPARTRARVLADVERGIYRVEQSLRRKLDGDTSKKSAGSSA